jgi:hypothetical protein
MAIETVGQLYLSVNEPNFMASSYMVQPFLTEYWKCQKSQLQPTNHQHVPAIVEIPIWLAQTTAV